MDDQLNEWHEEYNHEIRARDHSLRTMGAVVLQLFAALERQDQEIGSGRQHRSTPLGTLLHDCAPSVFNYKERTLQIDRLNTQRRRRALTLGGSAVRGKED